MKNGFKLDIDESEKKNFWLLFQYSLLSGLGISFAIGEIFTYFVQNVDNRNIPVAYVLSGVLGYFLMMVYKKLQKTLSISSCFYIVITSFAFLMALLYISQTIYKDNKLVSFLGFMILMPFIGILMMVFASVCTKIFNISQSKRLLGLISTGESVASIIAFLLLPLFEKFKSRDLLLLASTIVFLLALVPLRSIFAGNKHLFGTTKDAVNGPADGPVKDMDGGLSSVFSNKYYLFLALSVTFVILTFYITDYSFINAVNYFAIKNNSDISLIIAIVLAVVRIGDLFFSALSGKLIRLLGIKYSLVSLSVALTAFSFLALVIGTAFHPKSASESSFYIIYFIIINKFIEGVANKGLYAPSIRALFQAAPANERISLQTNIDGTVVQIATIFSGIIIFIIPMFLGEKATYNSLLIVSGVSLLAYLSGAIVNFKLFSHYRIFITNFLKNHKSSTGGKTNSTDIMPANINQPSPLSLPLAPANEIVTGANGPEFNRQQLRELIISYFPMSGSILFEKEFNLRQLGQLYEINYNLFCRMLIIKYLALLSKSDTVDFINEFYAMSDKPLRLQMLKLLNTDGYQIPEGENYNFTNLCREAAAEILWVELAINDIADKNDKLTDLLRTHARDISNIFFELLKVIGQSSSIQVIQNILNGAEGSFEDRLFAIELFDITLTPEIKKWVMPLFGEPGLGSKMHKLKDEFAIYSLPYAERLKEIIIRDFKLISADVKEEALKAYYTVTKDTSVLNAFLYSGIESLNAAANSLKNNNNEHAYFQKKETLEHINAGPELSAALAPYFLRWGIIAGNLKGSDSNMYYQTNPEYLRKVASGELDYYYDTLGLKLLTTNVST